MAHGRATSIFHQDGRSQCLSNLRVKKPPVSPCVSIYGIRPWTSLVGLAFEGAGGACWEFDGVFGAGFFGVLFQG